MISKKQTYIAVAVALVVVVIFIMLGFFGVSGFGGNNSQEVAASDESQVILDELSKTGTVSQLRKASITQGTGEVAEAGDTVTVHYIGVLPDGTVFDSSRDRGTPFSFVLGGGQVIQGWDQGLMGTHVGDRFILAIPPDMGYGAAGAGGVIPPNATLLFDIEVLGVTHPGAAN